MNQGIFKAALGLRYLIKYAKTANNVYFEVIKDCEKEIKLWCLITLFSNNMDDLWENVPNFIFEDLFSMKRIETFKGVLNYGRGYHSNSSLNFKEQFKYIRNKLSHKNFRYEDGIIYLDDNNDTYFDFLWLEKVVLSTIANSKNDFKKGISDVAIFSLLIDQNTNSDNSNDFYKYWTSGFINLYRVTLLTGNKESLYTYFKDSGIEKDRYTFDLLFNSVKYNLSTIRLNSTLFLQNPSSYLKQIFKDVESNFGNFVKLELVDKSILNQYICTPGFENLSFQAKLQYLINRLKMEDDYAYNSILVLNLFEALSFVEKGIYDIDHLFILKDAKDFFIKVYANILFSGIYAKSDDDLSLKQYLLLNYSFDIHFVHAKNVYKDYIRAIKRCLDELKIYDGPLEYQHFLSELVYHYNHLLQDAIDNKCDKSLFWNLRNAITHNQIVFDGENIKFYITGRNIHLKHFNKKKKEWTSKEFINHQLIWEMIISKDEFLKMMDRLYELAGIPISINIARLIKKRNKG